MTTTLDDVVIKAGGKIPWPDLIKIDCQGAELDILKGASNCLNKASHLILELQHTNYNEGAPHKEEVVDWLSKRGWELVGNAAFCLTEYDGDYHFRKKALTD